MLSPSSHGPEGYTFGLQLWADSDRSYRVEENNNLYLCQRAADHSAALFVFGDRALSLRLVKTPIEEQAQHVEMDSRL